MLSTPRYNTGFNWNMFTINDYQLKKSVSHPKVNIALVMVIIVIQ